MTFYFYDLETSGVNPRSARVMQFAGQRTNENLEPIGDIDDIIIKLAPDVLPEADAILIHGITPQRTWSDGITEAEFSKYFYETIVEPGTVFVGYNNIRFDDEFMRYLLFRNYRDPYAWAWREDCSRWDLLDVVRMTRALRPDGINWPVGSKGEPSNRLELLTAVNKIEHSDSHNAAGDVRAMIDFARLLQKQNPKLFKFMFDMRDKKKVKALVTGGQPFVYVSGRYDSRYEKLTLATSVYELEDKSGSIVFDLRFSPNEWAKKTDEQLKNSLVERQENSEDRLPFKILQYNRCPSVAPTSVVDEDSKKRLEIKDSQISKHLIELESNKELISRVKKLFEERKRSFQTDLLPDDRDPDTKLYDNFVPDADAMLSLELADASPAEIKDYRPHFVDSRLNALFPLYKARNYPKLLNPDEKAVWEEHLNRKLYAGGEKSGLSQLLGRVNELTAQPGLTKNQLYLLEELKLYAESMVPFN